MATIQRGLSCPATAVDRLRLRYVYRMLRDLRMPRVRMVIQVLSARGPMHVTDIEREMYHAGDHIISQDKTSQAISILRQHRVIQRHPTPPGGDGKHHYYGINEDRILRINAALDRFLRPPQM